MNRNIESLVAIAGVMSDINYERQATAWKAVMLGPLQVQVHEEAVAAMLNHHLTARGKIPVSDNE